MKSFRCPQCRKITVWEGNSSRPFCSERCRFIDLGAWANEEYRIPGEKRNVIEADGFDTDNENSQ